MHLILARTSFLFVDLKLPKSGKPYDWQFIDRSSEIWSMSAILYSEDCAPPDIILLSSLRSTPPGIFLSRFGLPRFMLRDAILLPVPRNPVRDLPKPELSWSLTRGEGYFLSSSALSRLSFGTLV